MSIVVNMDMPKSCKECFEKCGIGNHCKAFSEEDWGLRDVSCVRARNCPIIRELPNGKGKWLKESGFKFCSYNDFWKCDRCNFISENKTKFCGGCGADMRE